MPAMSADTPSPARLRSIQQQKQRIQSFRTLLDPTDLLPGHNVADLYSLRHLCLQGGGIPDTASSSSHGWLRSQAWKVLLGYLSPEKSEWNHTLDKRRAEYYQFARDFLPQHASSSSQRGLPGKLSERDALLDQIYLDLSRSRKNAFAFYREEIKPSRNCPLAPAPSNSTSIEERISARHSLLEKLESINVDFAHAIKEERKNRASASFTNPTTNIDTTAQNTPKKIRETHLSVENTGSSGKNDQSPSITVHPASPGEGADTPGSGASDDDSYFASADEGEQSIHAETKPSTERYIDRRWHSLLRILYIYALLNPSIGYVQGMNEVLFVLLYVLGTSGALPRLTKTQEVSYEDETIHQRVSSEEMLLAGKEASTSFHYLDDDENIASASHAEADAFWCFSALVGDIRDLYDFDGMENAGLQIVNKRNTDGINSSQHVSGMAAILKKFSLRLKWLDLELWRQMRLHSLDPRLPYFSFRWLACLISTELTLPSVLHIWDAILSESNGSSSNEGSSKIDFLIDICCSLLINIRQPLFKALKDTVNSNSEDLREEHDSFGRAMIILQHYPEYDVEPIVEMACLYRQRRMAAPLTGDGPSTEDDHEDEYSLSSVRDRAAKALRNWSARSNNGSLTSTPTRSKPMWLSGSPRTPSNFTNEDNHDSTNPSRSTSAALLKRYTEAVQSSDTAASFSKAGTNLTAKAMATWGANRTRSISSNQTQTLADFKNSFVNRVRSATSGSLVEEKSTPIHPSLRWSTQGVPPNLPVPDVNDSPIKDDESTSATQSTRSFTSLNRLGAMNTHNGEMPHSPDGSQISSTPGTSPTLSSMSRFGPIFSPQSTPRGSSKNKGPKPLLLTSSAKPPRERSPTESTNGDDIASRKVSSGPLAANISSPNQQNYSRRRQNGSRHGADSASATSSNGGESTSNEAVEEEAPIVKREKDISTLPLLPSLQAFKKSSSSSLNTVSPLGFQGIGSGTVPAAAFSRVKAASSGMGTDSDSQHSDKPRPNFGQVASSANVPLATKTTLQRKPQRTNSDQSVSVNSNGTRSSPHRDSGGSVSDKGGSVMSRNRHSLRSPPTTGTEEEQKEEEEGMNTIIKEPKRYTLTDEPSTMPDDSQIVRRNGSSSSNRSSVGLSRSKRAYSGGKRTSNRRSLGYASSSGVDEGGSREMTLTSKGGSESMRLGTIETGSFGVDFDSQMNHHHIQPPEILAPKIPSPSTDSDKILPSEELLQRLQLDHGYSGGESSGFEDEYPTMPSRTSKKQQSYRYL